MDDASKHLTRLLRSGAITPQTYAEGLSALPDEIQGPPTPTPRRRRPITTRRQRPTPAPRGHPTAEMDAYIEEILSQMPDERPIPAPRRRRPIPAPRQLEFRRTRWVIGSFLRGWQMDVPQGHPHGADPRAFLDSGQARGRDQGSEWKLNFSWLSRYSFGRTTRTAVRSTQTLCCATSMRLFCKTVKSRGPQSSFPHDPRNSGEVDAERVRLGCRSSGSPLAGHRQISATKRRFLHSTTSSGAT